MIQSLIICIRLTLSLDYETIGCYKDTWNRAITVVEGKDPKRYQAWQRPKFKKSGQRKHTCCHGQTR